MTLTRKETIERLKQNKAAAEYYAGQSRINAEIENSLKDSEAFDMAIEALSADAVQGEWKIDEYGIYHCPFCHAINNTVYKSFCQNCGAKNERREP